MSASILSAAVRECKDRLEGLKDSVAAQGTMFGVPSRFLSYWLVGAASLRMLSVFIGVFNPDTFKKRVYRLRCELFCS